MTQASRPRPGPRTPLASVLENNQGPRTK